MIYNTLLGLGVSYVVVLGAGIAVWTWAARSQRDDADEDTFADPAPTLRNRFWS